jgi:TolB-like protein/Flp pilus assembly protein TadD
MAAIVFTDVVGYSKTFQHDEALALRLLDQQSATVRAASMRHGGREVKTIGDGFLLEFPSAMEAVGFAVDVQEELRRFNSAARPGENVSVRIGIHAGDVISRDGDLIGDVVNITSRIVQVAPGGGICISSHVYDQVKNRARYTMEKLPPVRLKNIDLEMSLYRVVLPWEWAAGATILSTANRIAVLPFVNISPDPNDSYFADGLTEELISALSEVGGLRVIARTSVDHYRNTPKNAKQIGSELGVSYLLEGSVRKTENRIRIVAHLVDTESQEEVWSDRYEKDLVDVFSIQSDIADRVVDSLKLKLASAEKARMWSKDTENIAAYIAYLKGRNLLRDGTEEAVHLAREQFELAMREDEGYARAHVGMADTLMLLGDYLFSPVPVALEEATRHVRRALTLDPNLAEARVSLANLLMYDYRFDEAEKEFRRAIEFNPSYATGHHWYSVCLQCFGRFEEAMQQLLEAEELDPLSPSIALTAVYRMSSFGRYDEAMKRIRKLEEIARQSPLVDEALMVYNFVRKDWDATLTSLNRMIERDPADPYLDMDLAYIYAVTGRREDALRLVEKLKQVREDMRIRGMLLALVYVGLGDMDAVFQWLNYALTKKEVFMSWVRTHPAFEQVRADPRFRELLKAANLPPD